MSEQTYIARDEWLADTAGQGDVATMSRLERALRDFHDYYERLNDVKWGAAVARSGDMELYRAYGEALQDAERMKSRIEAALGAWDKVKGMVGLNGLPLIPLAIAAGLIAAIAALVSAGNSFIRKADIRLAMNADPDLTYEQAAAQVDRDSRSDFGRVVDLAHLALTGGLLYLAYRFFRG